jgi:hypothetical protein
VILSLVDKWKKHTHETLLTSFYAFLRVLRGEGLYLTVHLGFNVHSRFWFGAFFVLCYGSLSISGPTSCERCLCLVDLYSRFFTMIMIVIFSLECCRFVPWFNEIYFNYSVFQTYTKLKWPLIYKHIFWQSTHNFMQSLKKIQLLWMNWFMMIQIVSFECYDGFNTYFQPTFMAFCHEIVCTLYPIKDVIK